MSTKINIRFYAELNDLVAPQQRNISFEHESKKPRSVKDLIESIGVPHTEIDLIIVDGVSVDFSHPIAGGEQISVYPLSVKPDISARIHNQPEPLSDPRFVLDVHLGRLAVYLRMVGFDCLYRNDYDDPDLAEISASENRILLTCDLKLLMRKQVEHGYLLRSRQPRQQIGEVLKHFRLFDHECEFARCLRCNGIILQVDKQEIVSQLLPLTSKYYDEFFQCEQCKKIYWEGSHYKKMQAMVETLKSPAKKCLRIN